MNTLDQEAIRSIRGAVPDVRKPARWIEDGQELACVLLGLVIACEVAFIAKCLLQIAGVFR